MTGVFWVDDFVFYKAVEWHDACEGRAGGCQVCRSGLAEAEVLDEGWMDLCDRLGVSLNTKKHQRCGQSVEYGGFRLDSFHGRMLVLPDKLALLLTQAASLGGEGTVDDSGAR